MQEITYRMYVSEGVKALTENTFLMNYKQGSYFAKSLSEVLEDNKKIKDNRTGEEIIEHMKARLSEMSGEE